MVQYTKLKIFVDLIYVQVQMIRSDFSHVISM
jgi:hypothetical protein